MSYWVKCESEAKFCHGMSNVRPDPSRSRVYYWRFQGKSTHPSSWMSTICRVHSGVYDLYFQYYRYLLSLVYFLALYKTALRLPLCVRNGRRNNFPVCRNKSLLSWRHFFLLILSVIDVPWLRRWTRKIHDHPLMRAYLKKTEDDRRLSKRKK